MRSPEQQFALAKGLPISELAKVMQGQSDVVDMAIAQMVLREKTRAQKMQQGANAQQMAQQPKVAEKDLMEAGIAAAPVDVNVPQGGIVGPDGEMSDTAAGGGIVAFAAGDQVGARAPSREAAAFRAQQAGLPPIGGPKTSTPARSMFGLRGSLPGMAASMAYDALFGTSQDEVNRLKAYEEAKGFLKQQGLTDKDIGGLSTEDIFGAAQAYGYKGQRGVPVAVATKGITDAEAAMAAERAKIEAGQGPNAQKGIAALEGSAQSGRVTGLTPETIAQLDALKKRAETSSEEQGIKSIKNRVDQLINTPEALTIDQVRQQRKALYKAEGIAEDPYAFAEEDYKKAKEELSVRRGKRGWEAGLEAGLGMMGGDSPYALVNIGNAGKAALKSWSADNKEMDKLDRDLLKEKRSLDIARNNYKKSMADSDLAKVEKRQEKIDSINLKKAELQIGLDVELAKAAGLKDYRADEADRALLKAAQTTAADILGKRLEFQNLSPTEQARQVSQMAAQLYNAQKAGYKTSAPSGNTLKFDAKGNPIK